MAREAHSPAYNAGFYNCDIGRTVSPYPRSGRSDRESTAYPLIKSPVTGPGSWQLQARTKPAAEREWFVRLWQTSFGSRAARGPRPEFDAARETRKRRQSSQVRLPKGSISDQSRSTKKSRVTRTRVR